MNKHPYSGIKPAQLAALVAVAECGAFGEAAWKLGVTQPTVSHAIATLEEELGVILFSRGRHGAHLTPVGAQIIDHSREILRLLDVVTQQANRHKGLQGGQVRITTFRSAAANLLPKVMAQFHKQYPAIAVTITEHYDYTNVEHDIRGGKADIGLTFLPASTDLETLEILSEQYVVLLPAQLDWGAPQLTWEQLASLPMIMFTDDNSCFTTIRDYFRQWGYSLNLRYQVREISTVLNMAAQGLGATILPQLATVSIPSGIRIRQLPTPLERRVGAAILADSLQTPAVFAFLEALKQTPTLIDLLNPPEKTLNDTDITPQVYSTP